MISLLYKLVKCVLQIIILIVLMFTIAKYCDRGEYILPQRGSLERTLA